MDSFILKCIKPDYCLPYQKQIANVPLSLAKMCLRTDQSKLSKSYWSTKISSMGRLKGMLWNWDVQAGRTFVTVQNKSNAILLPNT